MKNRTAAIFIFLFTVAAVLPLVQQFFKPIKLAGLQGAFDSGKQPSLSLSGWMSGTYQSEMDHYLKYNTAFNGELVRLRNQLDYSAFGNINTILTLGKDNYIFDPNYILSREGKNVLPDSTKALITHTFSVAMSRLKSLGIPLLVIFAPNKANFYPEYLPVASIASDLTNKIFFKELVGNNSGMVLDADNWFVKMKSGKPFPLIPKYGAHWSTYGAALAADSMLRILDTVTGKKIASFQITAFETTDKPRFTDDDYLASLNLMQKFKSPVLAYPVLEFKPGYKPNALIISDSFIWNWYDLGIMQWCFDERSQLWYYQKTGYDMSRNNSGPLSGKIVKNDLIKRDLVILLISEPGLTNFGYGFFEQLNTMVDHE